MKEISILSFLLLYLTVQLNATVILCNDKKFRCYVINHLPLGPDGANVDPCCYDITIQDPDWDCVDDCGYPIIGKDRGGTPSRVNQGGYIEDGNLIIEGAVLGILNPRDTEVEDQEIEYSSINKDYDMEEIGVSKVTLVDNVLRIGEDLIGEINSNGTIENVIVFTIQGKERLESENDVYIFETKNNDLFSLMFTKDVKTIEIRNDQLEMKRTFENIKSKHRQLVDLHDLPPGKYYITFISNDKMITKQIIKLE